MNTTAARAIAPSTVVNRVLWFVTLAVGVYFVARNVPRYLIFSPESYGPYYWPKANFLLPHVIAALTAITIGPFQFWTRIRSKYPKVHRVSGRVYLAAILVGSIGAFGMASSTIRGLAYASGLSFLAIAWLTTAGMAFASIRKRNFNQHKQWMIRSYVVTFAFVSFRIGSDIMAHYDIADPAQRRAMLAWACWAVPLLFTEVVLQGKQIFSDK